MTQGEWIAKFADREQAWRDARSEFHRSIGTRGALDVATDDEVKARPVVIDRGRDVHEDGDSGRPDNARRLLDLAHSLGWAARVVAALAADPAKGLISSVSVRFSRHDERGFAAWWNGAYECGWFVSKADGLERLAGTRMRSRKAPKDPDAKMIRGYQDVVEGIRWS